MLVASYNINLPTIAIINMSETAHGNSAITIVLIFQAPPG